VPEEEDDEDEDDEVEVTYLWNGDSGGRTGWYTKPLLRFRATLETTLEATWFIRGEKVDLLDLHDNNKITWLDRRQQEHTSLTDWLSHWLTCVFIVIQKD
jgi:hypothetical protein